MPELTNIESTQTLENKDFQFEHVVITPETDKARLTDIRFAYNYAREGMGAERDGKKLFLLPIDFFDLKTTGNDVYEDRVMLNNVDLYFHHKYIGDPLEGGETLEGTQWLIVDSEVNDKKVSLIIPLDETNERTDKELAERAVTIFTEPGLKKYLDGVERYCVSSDGKPYEVGFGEKKKRHLNARRLGHDISNTLKIGNNWRVVTYGDVKDNKEFPEFIKDDPLSLLGGFIENSFGISGDYSLRFCKREDRGKEPFVLVRDNILGVETNLICDGVSPFVAERGINVCKKSISNILDRIPRKNLPRNLSIVYTEDIRTSRPGGVYGGVLSVGLTKDGESEKYSTSDIIEHESVHAILFGLYGHSKSSWLTEGMAMYLAESKGNSNDLYFRKGDVLRIGDMKNLIVGIDKLTEYVIDDGTFEYYGGQLLVAFIEETYDREFLFDLYKQSCDINGDTDTGSDKEILKRVVESMLPISFQDFNENFKEYVKEKINNHA